MSHTTFYATIDADTIRSYIPPVPVLLVASSFARRGFRVPKLPEHVVDRAADCGGYVATMVWGDYRYGPEEYVSWLRTWRPGWAATMDYCCEDEITSGNHGVVRERQQRTSAMAELFWREYRQASWCWVPTIQGWDPDDYRRHAREIAPLVAEMQEVYGPASAFRVGVGTLCRRASTGQIRDVVRAVQEELPDVPLHLWGLKLGAIQAGLPSGVASVDSAAWNSLFGRGREEWRASGLTQRRWSLTVALPRYLNKVSAAFDRSRTLPLLFGAAS